MNQVGKEMNNQYEFMDIIEKEEQQTYNTISLLIGCTERPGPINALTLGVQHL